MVKPSMRATAPPNAPAAGATSTPEPSSFANRPVPGANPQAPLPGALFGWFGSRPISWVQLARLFSLSRHAAIFSAGDCTGLMIVEDAPQPCSWMGLVITSISR